MPENNQEPGRGPFIRAELRPSVGFDLAQNSSLEPGASKEEIQRRASEVVGETQRARLGLADGGPAPAVWETVFTKSPDAQCTELDGEAVLLNIENGTYYTLNRVGTVIWQLLMGEQPLEGILAAVCERFAVNAAVAREDLLAFVSHLQRERLIVAQGE